MDEITSKLFEKGVELIIERAVEKIYAMTPNGRVADAYREIVQESALEVRGFLKRVADTRWNGDMNRLAEHLSDTVTAREVAALVGRLFPEVVHSTTQERRRMLAAALASSFLPDFDGELKSRLARAVAILEPSDVLHLYYLENFRKVVPDHVTTRWQKNGRGVDYSNEALQAAGCLAVSGMAPGRPPLEVTKLGRELCNFLGPWMEDLLRSPGQP